MEANNIPLCLYIQHSLFLFYNMVNLKASLMLDQAAYENWVSPNIPSFCSGLNLWLFQLSLEDHSATDFSFFSYEKYRIKKSIYIFLSRNPVRNIHSPHTFPPQCIVTLVTAISPWEKMPTLGLDRLECSKLKS